MVRADAHLYLLVVYKCVSTFARRLAPVGLDVERVNCSPNTCWNAANPFCSSRVLLHPQQPEVHKVTKHCLPPST